MTPRTSLLPLAFLATLLATSCRELVSDTEIGRAAATGDLHALQSLLRGGTDPDLSDRHGYAPLHGAARNGHVTVIRALVKAGAKVDLLDRRNGWTPLLHAVHKRQHRTALALLESGADPNGRNWRLAPLVMAAGYGNTEIVKALLQHGADPYVNSAHGPSALWAAVGGGAIADITDGPPLGTCFPDTVQVLLERAPDLKLERNAVMTRVVRFLGRSQKCQEAFALIERGARS